MNKTITIKINKNDLLNSIKYFKKFNSRLEEINLGIMDNKLKIIAKNINNYAITSINLNLENMNETTTFLKINYLQFLNALNYININDKDDNYLFNIEVINDKYFLKINNINTIQGELAPDQHVFIKSFNSLVDNDTLVLSRYQLNMIKQHILPFICKDKDKLAAYSSLSGILFKPKEPDKIEVIGCDTIRLSFMLIKNSFDLTDEVLISPELFNLLFNINYDKVTLVINDAYISFNCFNTIFYYKKNIDDYPMIETQKLILQQKSYNTLFTILDIGNFISQLELIKPFFIDDHYITIKISASTLELRIRNVTNKWEYKVLNTVINNKPFEDKIIRLNYDLFIRTLKTFNKKAQVNVFYNNSEDPLFFIDLENNILKLQLPLRSKEENDN